jgi:hypothetical protein
VRKVVTADACVGVEAEERLVFFGEPEHELDQQRVLEYVGEIAGMKQMSVSEHLKAERSEE